MTGSRRAFLRNSALIGATTFGAGCLNIGPSPEERVRTAAEKFSNLRDISKALAGGYQAIAVHVRTEDGGLGEVFVNQHLPFASNPDELDPERPTTLFCRLTEEGQYEPAGVGWSVSAESRSDPPRLFNRRFHEPAEHHVPGQSNHYGLHAWVFDDNPDGVFDPLHPDLTGPAYVETLETVRNALNRFRTQVEKSGDGGNGEVGAKRAKDAGYVNTEEHISRDGKRYGVPFYNPDIEGIDPERPQILLYRMTDTWHYELMGAEWHVPVGDVKDPPELFGHRFHEPMEGHSPHTEQSKHYGLHAWLFRANPDGMFALFNPNP